MAAVAAGVVRHHQDDDWFHRTRAFAELSLALTVSIREQLAGDRGFRPSFLGHILVEILLDGVLIEQDVARLDQYYLVDAVPRPGGGQPGHPPDDDRNRADLPEMIRRFCTERFLYDYLDNAKLLTRLNRVMGRVNLPQLPPSFLSFLPDARRQVSERRDELLTDPTDCEAS